MADPVFKPAPPEMVEAINRIADVIDKTPFSLGERDTCWVCVYRLDSMWLRALLSSHNTYLNIANQLFEQLDTPSASSGRGDDKDPTHS